MLHFSYNDYDLNSLNINGITVKRCDSVKYLGVLIDDKLNWKKHIDYIYSQLAKFIGIFYQLSYKLPEILLSENVIF